MSDPRGWAYGSDCWTAAMGTDPYDKDRPRPPFDPKAAKVNPYAHYLDAYERELRLREN